MSDQFLKHTIAEAIYAQRPEEGGHADIFEEEFSAEIEYTFDAQFSYGDKYCGVEDRVREIIWEYIEVVGIWDSFGDPMDKEFVASVQRLVNKMCI